MDQFSLMLAKKMFSLPASFYYIYSLHGSLHKSYGDSSSDKVNDTMLIQWDAVCCSAPEAENNAYIYQRTSMNFM